jgi:hypothetical protein
MDTGEVMRTILARYEAGELISRCAWCGRVAIDGEWLVAPHAALTAIDAPRALSHSICPTCAARQPDAASPSDDA